MVGDILRLHCSKTKGCFELTPELKDFVGNFTTSHTVHYLHSNAMSKTSLSSNNNCNNVFSFSDLNFLSFLSNLRIRTVTFSLLFKCCLINSHFAF